MSRKQTFYEIIYEILYSVLYYIIFYNIFNPIFNIWLLIAELKGTCDNVKKSHNQSQSLPKVWMRHRRKERHTVRKLRETKLTSNSFKMVGKLSKLLGRWYYVRNFPDGILGPFANRYTVLSTWNLGAQNKTCHNIEKNLKKKS